MLSVLNILQLVLYIALLSLAGQGLLALLAGPRRHANVFYRVLGTVPRPFTAVVRRLTPARLPDRHVPWLTFALLLPAYVAVTFEKIALCLRIGLDACR
jgi:hypothetical protein